MKADLPELNAELVERLIAGRFPQWAGLPVRPVPSGGTANAIFRLGPDLSVRLPRLEGALGEASKEQTWLAELAPQLPLAIPVVVEMGDPAEDYPWPWSVYRWIDGEEAHLEQLWDPHRAAADLGRFVAALQSVDPTGGPPPGPHNWFRGVPLEARDEMTRTALTVLGTSVDAGAVLSAWQAAIDAPAWRGPGRWIHGDLIDGNLLAADGRLTAVIDFGCLGVGDPACDVMAAWTFLGPGVRQSFRSQLEVDEATWARGRGWALSFGLVALAYLQDTNPQMAEIGRRAVEAALDDQPATA